MITHYSDDSLSPRLRQWLIHDPISPNDLYERLYLGNLPINDIIPDEATRGKLENGEYECVVIYDEKSITKIAKMVYQTITRTTQTRVAVLKGIVLIGLWFRPIRMKNNPWRIIHDFRWYRRYGTDTSGYDWSREKTNHSKHRYPKRIFKIKACWGRSDSHTRIWSGKLSVYNV